jgi:hypothetical protein
LTTASAISDVKISELIKPSTDENVQAKAALDVIRRLVHEKADNVAIKVNFKLPANYFKVNKFKFKK